MKLLKTIDELEAQKDGAVFLDQGGIAWQFWRDKPARSFWTCTMQAGRWPSSMLEELLPVKLIHDGKPWRRHART